MVETVHVFLARCTKPSQRKNMSMTRGMTSMNRTVENEKASSLLRLKLSKIWRIAARAGHKTTYASLCERSWKRRLLIAQTMTWKEFVLRWKDGKVMSEESEARATPRSQANHSLAVAVNVIGASEFTETFPLSSPLLPRSQCRLGWRRGLFGAPRGHCEAPQDRNNGTFASLQPQEARV